MTGKLKQQVIFGLLAWGLFAFLPNLAHAQAWVGNTGSIVGDGLGGSIGDVTGAQIIRAGGQEAVDAAAKRAGYESDNIRNVKMDDIKNQFDNIDIGKAAGSHVSGATNAAAARWKGSRNVLTGAWNVVTGGILDVFRSEDEIAGALEDYRTEDNAHNIDAANAAAAEIEKQKDSAKVIAKAAAVYETPDGQKVYMDKDMKSIGGLMEGCVPLPLKLEQSRKCILCPLFVILFNTAQTMSSASYKTLAGGFKNLLLIGFALYVAFVTLKQVSSFTKQDGPKYLSDLLTMSFKILLAYLILTHVDDLYEFVLEPMLNAAMEFGGAFLFRSASSNASSSFMACASASQFGDGITIASGYYTSALFAKIDCFVRSVQQELAVATSIGSSLMCVSHNEAGHWYGLPDMTMLSSGLIIWVFSWLVCLAFGFYLIDAVVRLGVVGGLMPFLIAAWPFKLTSGYTSKGWTMFMNTFFTFVFLGLVVSVNIELSLQAVTGGEGGYDKIMELVNANEVKPLVDIMSIGLMGLLFLILCCIFGFKLCSEAVTLAATMSGGSEGKIGSNIASLGAGAAKWGASKAAKATGKTAFLAGEALGVNDKIRHGKEVVGRKMYNGLAAAGKRLGLKGAEGSGSSGGGTGGTGGSGSNGGNGGNGGNGNRSADAQNRGNAARNQSNTGAAGNNGVADNQELNGQNTAAGATAENSAAAGQAGGAQNGRTGQTRGNSSVNDNNREGTSGAGVVTPNSMNPESANTGNGAGTDRPAATGESGTVGAAVNDNGAAAAGPRDDTARDKADQIVSSSKDKIAAAAQNAATNGASSGKSGKVENTRPSNNNGNKNDNKGNAADKKAQKQIEELQQAIANLEIERNELQKQLKARGGQSAATGTVNQEADRIKKLEEEKAKAESKLSSLMEALKNQK